jgi:glycosyltransferase involved in cell wall biosynthesis
VQSVLRQTHPHVHVFVVDDGSTDGTGAMLATISHSRLTVVRQAAAGVSAARNAGARLGSGAWLAFLDADDEANPDWLASMVERGHGAGVVGCKGRMVVPTDTDEPSVIAPVAGPPRSPFLAGLFIVRRELFDAVGGYDETMRRSENTDLGFRVLDETYRRGFEATSVSFALVTFHRSSHQAAKYSPAVRRESAETMLRKHDQRFARSPHVAASFHAIAGLAALRQGDNRGARSHLWAAVRLSPRRWRYWARLVQACGPPLRITPSRP